MKSVQRALVTGGSGFIGNYLVERLITNNCYIRVVDNLSSGSLSNLKCWFSNPHFEFVKGELNNLKLTLNAVKGVDVIFHLAANPEVRLSSISPETHFQQNIVATFNLLEATRRERNFNTFAFTSSSTIYGEASQIPTHEDYALPEPISVYGASKLACEALIAAYAHTYGFKAVIYRLANIVGSRSKHGVINDLIQKLKKNPSELEILGDGTQTKSYLHISDCIEALVIGIEKSKKKVEVFNVGSEDQIDVKTIAHTVVEEMKLENVKFRFTGGVAGGGGWIGDVKNMLLDISKLKKLGWKPKLNSEEAVRKATQDLLKQNF